MKGSRIGEFEEVVLLAVGHLDGEASSATIQQLLESAVQRRATLGAIYAALDRTERKKLVESQVERPAGSTGRPRRLYRLTDDGLAALAESRTVRETLWSGIRAESSSR